MAASNPARKKLKAAIEQAFDQVGGVDYLVKLAEEEPKTFAALLNKVLPAQVTGEGGGSLQIEVKRVIIRPDNSDG